MVSASRSSSSYNNDDSSADSVQFPRSTCEPNAATNGEHAMKRPYNGRCQYKTGKCFNERALKRNGTAHSLCEEHRRRQNLIQRRSDRKYQKVHAIRRRERTQRLKKQVSIAVARQLQQQQRKKFALSQCNPLQGPATNIISSAVSATVTPGNVGVARPFVSDGQSSNLVLPNMVNDELSPTGIDDFAAYSFMDILPTWGGGSLTTPEYDEIAISRRNDDNCDYVPTAPFASDKQLWSDADIAFLQTLLLP